MAAKGKQPRYLAAVRRALAGVQLTPGYHDVKVLHDDWCAIFKGGICNCNPEVKIVAPGKN